MRPLLPIVLACAMSSIVPVTASAQGHGRPGDRGGPEFRPPEREVRREGPHHFQRGERIAPQYRHRNYVVDDWRLHHLHAPPRGYEWIAVGADYLLVAIATGIIAEVMGPPPVAIAPPPPPPGFPSGPSIGGSAPPAYSYFCRSANAYYPYVAQCPEGWQTVQTR